MSQLRRSRLFDIGFEETAVCHVGGRNETIAVKVIPGGPTQCAPLDEDGEGVGAQPKDIPRTGHGERGVGP